MKNSFQNVQSVPFACSQIENNWQLTPNGTMMVPGVSCYDFHQNVQVHPGHQQKFVRTDINHVLPRPVWLLQQTLTYQWGISTSMVNVTYANLMTVEQTAEWIKALCANSGWQEADAYAWSFKKNNVRGCVLMRLNHEILKFDLDMPNHTHRRHILSVIRQLFPFLDYRDIISAPTRLSQLLGDDKNINTRNISLMPGLPNFSQGNHGVLYPAPISGGSTRIESRAVQNKVIKPEIRNKEPSREYDSPIKVGESKCKLDGSHYPHFVNIHRGTVRCY